jgi:hypothetical protein
MKPKSTTVLIILLATLSFGCASVGPSASRTPISQSGLDQDQIYKKAEPQNDLGWGLLYGLLSVGGQMLAAKYSVFRSCLTSQNSL